MIMLVSSLKQNKATARLASMSVMVQELLMELLTDLWSIQDLSLLGCWLKDQAIQQEMGGSFMITKDPVQTLQAII